MKIALLGAGHIGTSIARFLVKSGDYQVVIADRDAHALDALSDAGVATKIVDFSDASALYEFISHADGVVNALPYDMAIQVASVAKEAGVHYFDLTEDVNATQAIVSMADGARSAFMPQCGLAPGFVGIAAHSLSMKFDEVHDVKMRVGALPQFPTNYLKYNLTWSVDGLINEYCHPCEAIQNGALRSVEPLEGLEHFSLDGVEYEAFNTSGGLGTLCKTLNGRVSALDYKSVRYPGHCTLMKFLLNDLRLDRRTAELKSILRASVPTTMQDVVLIFVTVSGMRGAKFVQEVFSRKIFAGQQNDMPISAIQITTAAGVCAAVDLFREKRLPQSGFIRQEQIGLDDFLANRFGSAYNTGMC
ncbi:MAG: saccharopine dehydrogenase C-terminal domain-containing protein [Janthinobacterium lividum]